MAVAIDNIDTGRDDAILPDMNGLFRVNINAIETGVAANHNLGILLVYENCAGKRHTPVISVWI